MIKMKKFRTILIVSIVIFGAGLLLVPTAQAQDLAIQFENEPLFDQANFLPGGSVTRWVEVTNDSGQPQRIATEAINVIDSGDFGNTLEIVISEDGTDIYGGSTGIKYLSDFFAAGEVFLSDLDGGGSQTQYDFTIIFSSTANDAYQGKNLNFDILVGFQGTAGGLPPGGGSGGGGGGGGGGGLPPGLTIKYEKDIYKNATSVTITWLTSYSATSQVIYDILPGKFALAAGPSNYGYDYSKEGDDIFGPAKGTGHQVTITGLTPNTTYYYRIVSHASPATIGREFNFTTLEDETEITLAEVVGAEEEEGIVAGAEYEEGGISGLLSRLTTKLGGILAVDRPIEVTEPPPAEEPPDNLIIAPPGQEPAPESEAGSTFKFIWWLLILLIVIIVFIILINRRRDKPQPPSNLGQ